MRLCALGQPGQPLRPPHTALFPCTGTATLERMCVPRQPAPEHGKGSSAPCFSTLYNLDLLPGLHQKPGHPTTSQFPLGTPPWAGQGPRQDRQLDKLLCQ